MQNDTMIDSNSYHKIYYKSGWTLAYIGGLREQDKKIYYISNNCPHEIVLYDFNMNIGDSIIFPCQMCDTDSYPYYLKVVSIDSVLLSDMSYRKRINFDWGQNRSWIEGFGSQAGLLYPDLVCTTCMCYIELVCFRQNDTTLYSNENHVQCFDPYFSINHVGINNKNCNVFPNPVARNSLINFESESNLIKRIELYNILGNRIKIAQDLSSDKVQLENDNLLSGIYFYKVFLSNEENFYGKIIIE